MNYEEMSDFEINKLVVDKHLRMFVNESKSRGKLESDVWVFDSEGLPRNTNYNPCNNPSDAWPIIVENNISMLADSDYTLDRHLHKFKLNFTGRYVASAFPVMSDGFNCDELQVVDKNPLRAAMICFLKMKDAEK